MGRRVVGLDPQHEKGGAVTLAQHAAAVGEFALAGKAAGCASFFETLTMPSRVPAPRLEAAEAAW